MTLQAPLWLLIVPAAALVAFAAARARNRGRRALAAGWSERDIPRHEGRAGRARSGAELAACALLGVVLAAPQFGAEGDARRELPPVIFVVDGSRSMLAEDVAPDRFGAAAARLLVRARAEPGRRFGLVVFAGDATEICPPTADTQALAALLAEVHPRRRNDPGSDVSLGLMRALSRIDAGPAGRGGELVVLSDGEWDGDEAAIAAAASRARELGVRIGGECLGGPEPALIPLRDESGALLSGRDPPPTTLAAPARVAALASAGAAVATIDATPDPGGIAARQLRGWIAAGLLLLAVAHVLSGRPS